MRRRSSVSSDYPATIGSGTGMTLKELNRRVNAYLERKGMRQPPRQRIFTPDRVMARLRAPLSLLRATKCKADLWNQL